jgi:hypothetical protein
MARVKQPRENIVRGKGGFLRISTRGSIVPAAVQAAAVPSVAVQIKDVSKPTRMRTRAMTKPDTIALRNREVPKSKRKTYDEL